MSTIDRLLEKLNPRQREAASHSHDPLLIVAGAGTGKTTTLAHRVAYLIATGVSPGQIVLLTFTRRAASDMMRRVSALLRESADENSLLNVSGRQLWGGTFHAVASRLLRRHSQLIGLPTDFTIVDRADAEDLMGTVRTELGVAEKTEQRFPLKATCMDIYSRLVNTQVRLERLLADVFPWCVDHEDALKQLFSAYVDRKESQVILDYDDLLLFWNSLVAHPVAGEKIREQFECVLVDEFQDTNPLQASILKHMCPDGRGVTVVGDDAQAIYSFRAATVRNILDFPEEYPGSNVVKLIDNYRSTQPILDISNRVIAMAEEGHRKELLSVRGDGPAPQLVDCQDEDEQTDFVIDRILEHRESGTRLTKQCVLFRASHHSLSLELELTRRNIPFHKYGGLKFIETAHVKDMLAFFRLADNPRDSVAGIRVLSLLPGVGPKTATRLMESLDLSKDGFESWQGVNPPKACREQWPKFVKLMSDLANNRHELAADLQNVRTFYAPILESKYDSPRPRLNDLKQLQNVATRFPDRTTFLTEITLDPPVSTQDLADDPHLDEDYLTLSTIHSSKGLEWDAVYVLHASDGNIPSDMATQNSEQIEEERRLFYVALTRARDSLYVCFPQRYYHAGKYRTDRHSFSQVTRFLTDDIQGMFDRVSAGGIAGQDALANQQVSSTAEVRDSLKSLW